MIKPNLICRIFIMVMALAISVLSARAADRYSVSSGNWSQTSTWSNTSGGSSGYSAPVAGDNVFLEGGRNVTVNVNAACANLSVASGSTLTIRGNDITVNGTTVANGSISFSNSASGAKLFIGLVTIQPTGDWTNSINAAVTFRGGITNNGAFSAGTAAYTFTTNSQTIDGSASVTLPSIVITGITLTNANTSGLSVAGTISGTGNLNNGTALKNAILNLSGSPDPLTLTGTTDFTSNANTVNFNSTSAQTIAARNFYNLTISGARTANSVTLVNAGTIRILGAFAPVATFSSGNYVTTNNTIEFNGTGAQNIPAIGSATYNNITVSGNSIKTLVGNVTIGASGLLRLNGGIIELSVFNLTISNNAAGAIVPVVAHSSSNMISTGGTGYLQKKWKCCSKFPDSISCWLGWLLFANDN